ncbi:MAG: hypothetical protein AB7P00_13685 [Sandaracinaceae bacterium]
MHWADAWKPYGGGKRTGVGGLADEDLAKRLRTYKRQVAKRYRVIDPEQIERALGEGPYHIRTKLDGELWFLVKRDGEVALVSFNGRVVMGTPLVKEAERLLEGSADLIVAGELIARIGSDRPRVYGVATALNDDDSEGTLELHAFDLVEEGDKDALLADYASRLARLNAHFGDGERIEVVETIEGDGAAVLRAFREWVVSDRFEGIVVRSERGLTYKIKSTLTIDAVIIAYGERITADVHQVREMSVALVRDDGTFQLLGAVGGGFSEQDRARWHERLSAIECPSRFRLANREGTLSKFVRPEIVVEIRCSDLLASDSWDTQIRRMSLRYREEEGWEPLYETPTAVLIHPIFLRERTDKTVDVESIGMTQITSRVPLEEERESKKDRVVQADAEIVRRAVFSKTTKDKVAVRKYAIIATHKGDDRNYPAFLAFFTDYSPGRKDPLQTTLRPASTLARAEAEVVEWLGDNIKRGWGEEEKARIGELVPPPAEAAEILAKEREKRA